MRLTLFVGLGIVLGPALAIGDEKPARHFEKDAGFSFVPPKGWMKVGAAELAKADAAAQQADKDFQQFHAAVTQQIKQGIMGQLKRVQPGSFQAKLLKQQLDQLEKQANQDSEMEEQSTKLASRSILMCSGWAKDPAPSMTFSLLTPRPAAKGKGAKIKLADAVAQHKYVAEHTNPFSGVVAQKKLKTDAGAEFVVLVTKFFPATYLGDTDDRVQLRITHYFFELSPGRVLVATCSAVWDSKLDPVFEASLKTFRLEKP
jgi:hypothetical protein